MPVGTFSPHLSLWADQSLACSFTTLINHFSRSASIHAFIISSLILMMFISFSKFIILSLSDHFQQASSVLSVIPSLYDYVTYIFNLWSIFFFMHLVAINEMKWNIWKIIINIIIIKFEKKETLPKLSHQKTVNACETKKQMRNILILTLFSHFLSSFFLPRSYILRSLPTPMRTFPWNAQIADGTSSTCVWNSHEKSLMGLQEFQTKTHLLQDTNIIQWNLVITRSLGPWNLPCYIRFLIISG